MNNFMNRLKRKALKENIEITDVIQTFILPLTEMNILHTSEDEKTERMNAHDLFSFFTAEIIKEDVIFSR